MMAGYYEYSGGFATTSSATDSAWTSWNNVTSSSVTSDTVWGIWVDSGTTSGDPTIYSTSSGTVWEEWVIRDSEGQYQPISNGSVWEPAPETEEQRLAREERERQKAEKREAARLAKEEAQKKAVELLRETLDREQREQFEKTKWFFVISQSGKKYRIRHGWAGNIDEIDEKDLVVARYCIHPSTQAPIEDNMLIQKLMLEIDEERLLQIANKTTLSTPRPLAV